jgi:transcription-repair coupling factor (superfamily II helicase)
MKLSGLLDVIGSRRAYDQLVQSLAPSGPRRGAADRGTARHAIASVVEPAKPYLLAALHRSLDRPMLVVAGSEARARTLVQQAAAWAGDGAEVALLPAPEPLFYERLPSHPNTALARLRALQLLVSTERRTVVVASVRALMRAVDAPERFRALGRVVRTGDTLRPDDLVGALLALGYSGEALVEYPATFSRRGGIVDVYPVGGANPVRVEFFGDEVESIRAFDAATQRSRNVVPELRLTPSRELPAASPDALAELGRVDASALNPSAGDQWARDLERLAGGFSFDGVEFYAPYLASHSPVAYLPPNGVVVVDEPAGVAAAARELAEQAEELRTELTGRGELPEGFRTAYFDWEALERELARHPRLDLSWQEHESTRSAPSADGSPVVTIGSPSEFRPVPSYAGQLRAALDDLDRWRSAGSTTLLVSQQSSRLADLLEEQAIPAATVADVPELPEPGALVLVHGSLDEGFELTAGPEGGLVVLSDRELFGWTKPARTAPARRPSRDAFLSDLSPGDYVVHVDHGVGRFIRMLRMPSDGGEREYLVLEYAAGDKLYVPADQTDRVTRYVGIGDHAPTLHRLGTSDWARTRSKVKAAVQELAGELLGLYASRKIRTGHAFGADTLWQRELEDAFPYVETPDQLKAISDVKGDMEQSRPMDRLLCGDVGYGKTEVALRAAFKAVNDGRQVAVLVPTTVLAQQHYNTFRERLQAFPVKVEMLSRFRSDREQKKVIEGLAAGTVDICIGTHRLVQKDVTFKNLGLLIVDEEQRFGVLHKEHLKKLRTEVDVLTLTATPIPRTLHMALVGVRDLSVMETPPEDRLPIRTTVTAYDESLIREVILREIDRGGQVFFVHNRVQTIYQMAHKLGELVPHASIVVGHGQMPEEQLEKVMLDFAAGRYDVLVCSTIIESGLDIPNVNTIVVNQADNFGLAQLYQLRGRVGRGANRAYAYFLTPKNRQLSEIAEKRLRTIFEATDLGAGYRIALKDLEIRGAGNLLGAEQHGHVAAVGFHLYTQLLAEAVKSLQGEPVVTPPSVAIDLPLDAYLPASYVEDEQARLNLYSRMASLTDPSQTGDLMLELKDRFGELPEPALNLIYLVQLKLLAGQAGLNKITVEDDQIILQVAHDRRIDADKLRRRFGPLIAVGRTQLRLSRTRAGANWLAILQDIVDAMGEGNASVSGPPAPTASSVKPGDASRADGAASTRTASRPIPSPRGRGDWAGG